MGVLLLLGPGPAAAAPGGVWPLDPQPVVVDGFAPPASPWAAGHRGVDLAGRVVQPVRAALGGTVAFAGPLAGRGVLVVRHGGTRTTYEPVAALVPVGSAVARGEVVGVLEGGGSHCAPAACLHWGWRRGEAYLDPLLLVGGGPVRLLPLGGEVGGGQVGGGLALGGLALGGLAGGGPAATRGATAAAGGAPVPAVRGVAAVWRPLATLGLLPCPPQARGWACR